MLTLPNGRREPELRKRHPQNTVFTKLVDYRTYRLEETPPHRYREAMQRASRSLTYLEQQHVAHFNGSVHLEVLSFLAQYTSETEVIVLGELEDVEFLPDFFIGNALANFKTAHGTAAASDKAFTWPYAVRHLLDTYATDGGISQGNDSDQHHGTKEE